jgi:hypothetical protein
MKAQAVDPIELPTDPHFRHSHCSVKPRIGNDDLVTVERPEVFQVFMIITIAPFHGLPECSQPINGSAIIHQYFLHASVLKRRLNSQRIAFAKGFHDSSLLD